MKPRSWGVGLGLCCVLSAPAAAQTTRVSVASGGGQSAGAGAWSRQAAVSADGRYVAFESLALNLVAGDTNGRQDVFVHDRVLNITTRVSVGPAGLQADSGSETPAISADGRFVAFVSSASNLVPGDTNSAADVFVHDRISGQTTRVSVATGGAQAMKSSVMPALTADGRYVAFTSDANTLVAGDTNNQGDIFVHDRVSKVTTRVSVATGGAQGNLSSHTPVISGTGCLVAFVSAASNLVPGDTNGVEDVFVHDCATGVTTRVSVATGGGQSDGPAASSGYPSISADGRYVAFQSLASNLVERDTNGASDVFVHDRATTTTTRVSVSTGGDQAADFSTTPSMSGDGRYVAFVSTATNLVLGDTNGVVDVFLHDRVTSTTRRVSVATGGTQGLFTKDNNGNPVGSSTPSVSGDGRYVAFESWSFNLVDGDTNAVPDVFLHDARMYQRQRVNVSTAGVQAEGGAGGNGSPAASADGRFLAFGTNAPNLVSGDTNNAYDVFVRDRVANVTTRVSVASDGTQGNASSLTPRISRDGRYVAFTSSASNLVAGDTNGERDVFVHDRQSGETTRVSVADNGAQAAGDSRDASISDNGRLVAFSSSASNLVENDTNGATDVFVRDRATGRTTRVSVATGGTQGLGGHSWEPFVSGDGRFVAFTSAATNLVAGDDNAYDDIFVHDRLAGTTERVNVRTGGVQANPGHSGWSAMSRDGRYVVFNSLAPNLVVGDSNNLMDVFVHDRLTSQTSRVSVTTGGFQAGGNSLRPTISGDGRLVAFDSDAPNLVPDDTNAQSDVFVHDRVTGKTVRASLAPGERQGNSFSYSATFSGDGRSLVFLSAATDLTFGDTNNATDVFVRAATPVIDVVSPRSGSTSGETTLRITGAGFAPGTLVLVGGLLAVNVDGTNPERLWATTPPNVAGQHDIVVTVPGYEPQRLPVAYTYVALSGSAIDDADGDGLSDQYEAQFSLDLLDPGDATADLDADGPSTAAEQADGSHPNGAVKRYMAEGATSAFFKTEFALTNPGDGDATVQLRFLPTSGTPLHHLLRVPAHSRKTVDAKDVAGLQNAEFSTVMESDRTVVLDRTMHWDASGYGSHSETAISALSMTWYLAEGATHSGFDLFYLLQNPASTPTGVQVTYFLPAPQTPVVKNYTLPPSSRFNIWVDLESPFLASTDVSAQILASQPIAVERAMYLSGGGQLFAAGHQSAGVTAPMTSWFLAEGATGHFFDMFVLLANPSATAADVRVTFLKPDGSTLVRTYSVASQSRFNIWVDYEHPSLADTAVSTTVEVTNGVPIVVERSMWWPGDAGTWREAHNSPGATSTGTAWVVSGAEDGGANNAETYVLMANTASFAATVRVTALFDDGKTAVREFEVPAHSRTNVALRSEFPGAVGRRVGVLVESIGLGEAPLVVESAVYSDAGGVTWAAGSNALATRLR